MGVVYYDGSVSKLDSCPSYPWFVNSNRHKSLIERIRNHYRLQDFVFFRLDEEIVATGGRRAGVLLGRHQVDRDRRWKVIAGVVEIISGTVLVALE